MPEGATAATRSAYLELRDEQSLIEEGYDLLDQERILIAAEVLRQLAEYQAQFGRYMEKHDEAMRSLAAASARHGFNELSIYPPTTLREAALERQTHRFLGVAIDQAKFVVTTDRRQTAAVFPSPEAERCAVSFGELIRLNADLGTRAANLRRLCAKYVQTERRAKALENVLLPEIEQELKYIDEKLEEVEQEDVIRVRTRTPSSGGGKPDPGREP